MVADALGAGNAAALCCVDGLGFPTATAEADELGCAGGIPSLPGPPMIAFAESPASNVRNAACRIMGRLLVARGVAWQAKPPTRQQRASCQNRTTTCARVLRDFKSLASAGHAASMLPSLLLPQARSSRAPALGPTQKTAGSQ